MSGSKDEAMSAIEATIEAVQWPLKVKLQHPVELGSERIEELTLRRGRLKDIAGIKLSETATDHLILIASRMSGKPTAVIGMLEGEDAKIVMEVAMNFLAQCLEGGSKR